MKSKLLIMFMSSIFIANIASAKLSSGPDEKQPTGVAFSGSGGLLNLPSALTMKRGIYIGGGAGMQIDDGFNVGVPVQLNIGITNTWEVFADFDLPAMNHNDFFSTNLGFSVGTKWNFWDGDTWNMGIFGNVQFAGGTGDFMSRIDGQILFLMTYGLAKNFILTGGFGKTMGYGTDWAQWDVAIGLDYMFFTNANTQVHWINEFSNFNYQIGNDGMPMGNANNRGTFSSAVRFTFGDLLILNVAFLDLFNFKSTSFYMGGGLLIKY